MPIIEVVQRGVVVMALIFIQLVKLYAGHPHVQPVTDVCTSQNMRFRRRPHHRFLLVLPLDPPGLVSFFLSPVYPLIRYVLPPVYLLSILWVANFV